MSEQTPDGGGDGPQNAPRFDPSAPHQQRPKLRPVRGFQLQAKGPDGEVHPMLGLADVRQISDKMVATSPAAQVILPLMDGSRGLDQIVGEVGRGLTRDFLEQLVAQLDDAGLIEGPIYQGMVEQMRREFDSASHLPPATTAAFAEHLVKQKDGEEVEEARKEELMGTRLREFFDEAIDNALKDVDDPAFDELPRGIVAPHIDYARGWMNYASVWGRLRVADRPDRVVILGTNHFGEATGVTACDKGYETPLGRSDADAELLEKLKGKLGEDGARRLLRNRYDHEREHSVELQVAWMQHCLGPDDAGNHCRVLGVLVHDPATNNGESYDGEGVALLPFVEALRESLAELPGRTLVVASADLSHVGPAFGDQQPLAGEEDEPRAFRDRVIAHDKEMINLLTDKRPEEMVSSMAW